MITVEQSIFIKATPEVIMTVSEDASRMPEWFIGIESVESDGKWPAVGSTVDAHFKSADVAFTLVFTSSAYVPNEKSTIKIGGEGMLTGMNWWTLTPHDGGTTVSYKLDYELAGDHLAQAMDPNALGRGVEYSLNNLKKIVEG